jgi:predicted permease
VRLLLRLLVPRDVREEIEGDVAERYARIRERDGRHAADRWAWRQVMASRPFSLRRVLRGVKPKWQGPERGGGLEMGAWGWGHDLWLAHRALRARAGASLTVVLTLAAAVGGTTAVFSVVNGVLLRPLPFPEPDRLVRARQVNRAWLDSPNSQLRAFATRFPLSVPTFDDWTTEDTGFEALGAYANRDYVEHTPGGAEVLRGQAATSGLFAALGVEAELGRTLLPEDDRPGAPRVAVLGHGLWIERFGGDPDVLGRDLVLDDVPHAVVGVMPELFQTPVGTARLWAPLTDEDKAEARNSQFLGVVGRLAPEVSLEVAAGRLAQVQERLAETYPDFQANVGSRVEPLLDSIVGNVRSTLLFLLGAVGLVLLIASANIANLLSVMGLTRRRELAVRVALGASTSRLVRGLLIESAVLAAVGGFVGLLLAWASLPVLLGSLPPTVPRQEMVGIDGTVLLFGLAATSLTALLVGALPALQVSSTEPADVMRSGGRGYAGDRWGKRLRSALVAAEVALAFVLLVGAGLLGTSFWRLWTIDRGFATEGLVVMSVSPEPEAGSGRDERDAFLAELRDRLRAIPGVAVTATNQVPLSGSTSSTTYLVERAEGDPETAFVLRSSVLENYFDVMRIPVVAGRGLTATDVREAPPVAIVNQAMASALWPGESPLGKRLRNDDDGAPWVTVVGVAGDVRHQRLAGEAEPKFYLPVWQSDRDPEQWVLRTSGDVAAVIELARRAVAEVSPATPVTDVAILEERIASSVAVPRFRTLFVIGLAAMAGVLALLGVFGVVTLSVTQRIREIGVRMALGAGSGEVVRGVVGEGLGLAVAGIGLGLVAAVPATRALREFLFDVEPTDPLTYASIAVAVALVSGAASYLPARRAAAVDPVKALRTE